VVVEGVVGEDDATFFFFFLDNVGEKNI